MKIELLTSFLNKDCNWSVANAFDIIQTYILTFLNNLAFRNGPIFWSMTSMRGPINSMELFWQHKEIVLVAERYQKMFELSATHESVNLKSH